jgi:hypothetical protein
MYDFSSLSPADFKLLVRDLLEAEHGWKLKAFGHGRDGGVDLESGTGRNRVVVQCKHYTGSTFAQLKRAVLAERDKMAASAHGHYLLITSRFLSKTQFDTITKELDQLLTSPDDLKHRVDLNTLLEKHPAIEQNHFKLWLASTTVLRTIVNSSIWARSEALLEDIQSRVKLYVSHPGYDRAARMLKRRRVAVITGSPGVGKSLLAEMLLLTYWKEGWQVVQIGSNIEEGWSSITPSGKQIFLYDDFLGQTSFAESLGKNEDASISRFVDVIASRADKRLILTTRTQILKQAEDEREPLQRAGFSLRSCVVSVNDYDRAARARILYNHLYFSSLPRKVVRGFAADRDAVWKVVEHRNYSPRIIEQVLKRSQARAGELTSELVEALDRPAALWAASFEHGLSPFAQQVLLSLVSYPPHGASLAQITASCEHVASLARNQALKALEGTWIALHSRRGKVTVNFADPSCRDFILSFLDRYPETVNALRDRCTELDQLTLLLTYATSNNLTRGRATPAHPGMRSAVSEDPAGWLKAFDSVLSGADTRDTYAQWEEALGAVLGASTLIGRRAETWLSTHCHILPTQQLPHDSHDSLTLLRLIRFLISRLETSDDVEDKRRAEQTIMWMCGAAADSADDEEVIRTLYNVLEFPPVVYFLDHDVLDRLNDALADYIRNDLTQVESYYGKVEEMRDHVGDLEMLAMTRDLSERLSSEFHAAMSAIEEREQGGLHRTPDMSPARSQQAFGTPRQSASPADQDRSQISALFDQLS